MNILPNPSDTPLKNCPSSMIIASILEREVPPSYDVLRVIYLPIPLM